MIERILTLPPPSDETFFLWGPRQTGKSTLLKACYPQSRWIDLLQADVFRRYLERPELLREELARSQQRPFVVVDEVQKLPALLDEVHWLHENWGLRFALCGSSARKVRRGQANLLGGRALRYEFSGLVSAELKESWDLVRMLNHGYLPRVYLSQRPQRLLASYVGDYLREEIAAEGLVRKLPHFSSFLDAAALSDAQLVNFSTIARDVGVSSQTIRGYFRILEDTLLGSWLPAYLRRPKRRVIRAPKFYFADVGVVNFLARRGRIVPGSSLFGKAFENWCHHELRARNAYGEAFARLSYWRLASGIEVDFVVDDMRIAIEAKASPKITSHHLKGLRQLQKDHPGIERRIVVCLEDRPRKTSDGIEILPAASFSRELWGGAFF